MATVVWDIETFSDISLKDHGAFIYAQHPSTDVHFVCFAIDDGEVQTWRPGDLVPAVFANPVGTKFVSFNWTFEAAILRHVLVPRYGFTPIAWEQQDCAMRLALASAYPAELGLCCEALGLPYRKDVEARKAMLRLSRPQTAKKRKKPVDPAERERDLALLLERCKGDVAATRAVYQSPLLRPLPPEERELLLLDAKINERGVCVNVPFLEAVRDLAVRERNGVNLLAEGSYSVGSEIQDGYPEFTYGVLKKLGWDQDLTDAERGVIEKIGGDKADAISWSTDLSGGIQRVAMKRGCVPYGNAKGRMNAFGLPDPIPVHREPIYSPRVDLVSQ